MNFFLRNGLVIALAIIFTGTGWSADLPFRPEKFPEQKKLPDPFRYLDGSRVTDQKDWPRRRVEMLELVQRIQYGHVPPSLGKVALKRLVDRTITDDGVTRIEKHVLSMGPDDKIHARLDLYFPAKIDTSCPVILSIGWGCPIITEMNERGYIFAGFGPEQFDRSEEGNPTPGAVEKACPENDGGTLAAWAWGASRMLDYLLTLPAVDASKVALTGHSRCGKAALLAGAVDERFALVNPNGSGCGGAGLYRILGPQCEDLEAITRPERWQEWFHKDFRNHTGKEVRLPFDQHFMRTLIAPRLVVNTDATDDFWANPMGTQINYMAAQPVFDFLGVSQHNGMHFRSGGHDHTEEDFRALMDFADWHWLDKKPEREFNKLLFPEIGPDIDWKAP